MNELFKLNENGLYDFIGTHEDITEYLIGEGCADYVYNIKQYNDEFIMLYTGENKYNEIDTEFEQLENDTVYIDYCGTRYNLSCGNIIFFKVKDLKEPEEFFFIVPQAFEQLKYKSDTIDYLKIDNELLFEIARTLGNTFIDTAEMFEIAMKRIYGDIEECYWSKYSYDDYLKDLENRFLEERYYNYIQNDDIN